MNLEALAAMDDCEHATGMTLEQHAGYWRRTPKEILSDYVSESVAAAIVARLKIEGWHLTQVVQTGNKAFTP